MTNSYFYSYVKPITIDASTIVILDSYFDPSNYLLEGRNIWTINNNETGDIYMRVHNKSIPFIFNDVGTYDVKLESYDKYGNLTIKVFKGFITVRQTDSLI